MLNFGGGTGKHDSLERTFDYDNDADENHKIKMMDPATSQRNMPMCSTRGIAIKRSSEMYPIHSRNIYRHPSQLHTSEMAGIPSVEAMVAAIF